MSDDRRDPLFDGHIAADMEREEQLAFPDIPEEFWRVYEMPVAGDAVRLESVGWVTNGDYERWHSGEPILETS